LVLHTVVNNNGVAIAMFRQSSPIITVVAAIWAVVVAPVFFAVEPLSDR
jgi:lipoprotein signal peptidase